MANEVRRRTNNVQGTLSSTMNSTQTSMNSAGLANLEAISSTEHAAICIDPGRTNGAPEIVWVTAHTGSATSATIVRGKEGTAARAHSSTEDWVHAPTAATDFLPYRPPSARAHRDAAQSISNSAWNGISFDTEEWDTNTIWSSTAPTKFIAKTAGKYLVTVYGGFADSSGGTLRGVAIQKNTTTAGSAHEAESLFTSTAGGMVSISPRLATSMLVSLTTGQYVRMEMFQDSGGSINTSTNDVVKPRLAMIWMSS